MQRYLASAEQGQDPYPLERGKIVSRGYRSPISLRVQGYTVYVPPDYTPDKQWPLMIVLHGGSSNGNLFLGVVLGNNMNWKEYDSHLWDNYQPRWSPHWIVAAPDGYGQVLWRWMGEQDVLDVIERHQAQLQRGRRARGAERAVERWRGRLRDRLAPRLALQRGAGDGGRAELVACTRARPPCRRPRPK